MLETINNKYSNINYFLSNNNKYASTFLGKTGYTVIANEIYENPDNEFMNAFLGIKYHYDKSDLIKIEKNEESLSIGYMINMKENVLYKNNPFEAQNKISNNLTDLEIFQRVKNIRKIDNKISLNISFEKVYIYISTKNKYKVSKVRVNKIDCESNSIIKIDTIDNRLEFDIDKPELIEGIYVYSLNEKNMKKVLGKLGENQIYDSKIYKNKMSFKINNVDKETLLLTIPYDEGYEVYVDGKKTDYFRILDSFVGINLKNGPHSVTIKYIPKGLKTGIIISLIAMVTLLYILVKKCKKYN